MALVPESSLRAGRNELRVYEVVENRLRPLFG